MKAKTAAVIVGLVISAAGLGVGVPLANANPAGGGQCNNYGNGNVIVAPFCGATIVPSGGGSAPVTTTTKPVVGTLTPSFPPWGR
jgi:hypothetical protein